MKISGITAFNNAMCLLFSTKEGKKEAWCDAVAEVMGHLNVDYDRLYKYILNNYKSDFLPNPAVLKEMAKPFVKVVEQQATQWRQPVMRSPGGFERAFWAFPINTTDAEIVNVISNKEGGKWELVSG